MTEFELQFLPANSKKMILGAAGTLAATHGPLNLNLASIAREAGISRPNLSYHYNDIASVFSDLCISWAKSGQTVTAQHLEKHFGSKPEELILEIVEATFKWKQKCPNFSSMTPTLNLIAHQNKKVAEVMRLTTDTGLKRLQGLVEKVSPRASSPTLVAQTVHLNLIGGFLYHLSTNKFSDAKMVETIKNSIRLVLET